MNLPFFMWSEIDFSHYIIALENCSFQKLPAMKWKKNSFTDYHFSSENVIE